MKEEISGLDIENLLRILVWARGSFKEQFRCASQGEHGHWQNLIEDTDAMIAALKAKEITHD